MGTEATRAASRRYYRNNREKVLAREKARQQTPGPQRDKILNRQRSYMVSPKGRFNKYRKWAESKGRTFVLTPEQFESLLMMPCHYCGRTGRGGVDRVDSRKGYEVDNCVPCCRTCNVAKSDLPVEEFLAWVEAIHSHQQKQKAQGA